MRLLYVIDSLVPGGAERTLLALAPRYVERGVSLEIAYLRERPGLQRDFEQVGTTLHLVEGEGRIEWMKSLTTLIRDRQPDLVHTTLFESDVAGRLAARRAHTPVVSSIVSEHYGAAHLENPALRHWKVRAAQAVDAVTARLAVRLHSVSTHVADVMARNLRYPRSRIDVVPRGRDAEALGTGTSARRDATRRQFGFAPHLSVVLAVARQEHAKGLDLLLTAMPGLIDDVGAVHLLIAGQEGGATEEIRALVDRLGLRESISFLGAREDIAELLCAADVFVLSSRREGSPGSLIEAMALNVPIVATDLPQIREIVDEASAVLVPQGSAPACLAHAIARVLREPDAAVLRARVARDRFLAQFTIGHVADEMTAFYDRALASTDRPDRPALNT